MIGWFIGRPLQQEKWSVRLGGGIGGLLASGSLLLFLLWSFSGSH
jgi:hypothetical protein